MSNPTLPALASLDAVIASCKLPFKLADLQYNDIKNAIVSERFGWFLDVGVGKTVCATLTALAWAEDYNLVVCPPILLDQWEEWLKAVHQPDTSIFRGPKRTAEMLNHKWVIMSHAIFRDSFDMIQKAFSDESVSIIIDEAQYLKNPKSKLFKSVNKLSQPDRRIQLLTGTPTAKPEDTYAYMRIKTPQLYRSAGHWDNLHVEARDHFGTITAYRDLAKLADNFALNSVKRTKREVFGYDLDPIYQPILYKLDDKHLKLYNQLAEEQLLMLGNGDKIDATTAQRLRHALQQIVVNWEKFSGVATDRSKSYDLLDTVIEEVNPLDETKSKLIVWTYYQATSKSVTAYLRGKYGSEAVAAAYGDVDSKKGVRQIMTNPKCRFLVAQPSSVGAGLNLQHCASENLFLEMATTPLVIRQALGRTDRIGQTIRPTMRFGQAKGTIQLKLFKDLLRNDDLVTVVERTEKSLRDEIFGVV